MSVRRVVSLLAVLAALLLVACGGDDGTSKEDYAKEVSAALTPLGSELQKLGEAARNPESPEELVSGISGIQDRLQSGADDLSEIEPPEEVSEAHDQLVGAFEDFSSALDPVKEAAEEGDEKAMLEAAGKLPNAVVEFQGELVDVLEQFQNADIQIVPEEGQAE